MKKAILLLILVFAIAGTYAQNDDPYAIFGHKSAIKYESSFRDLLYIINTDSCSNIKAIALDAGSKRVYLLGVNDSLIKILDLDPVKILTWVSVDPKADKYPGLSPYNYCKNNPIIFIDPDGRSANPIYDFDGNLMGTDDKGLQGRALFMSKDQFKQGMRHQDAIANDKGIMSLVGSQAISRFSNSFQSLPSRPDYDGRLTLDEADNWYRMGNGRPLYVDLSQIDLGNINSEDFPNVGDVNSFNLLMNGSSFNDFAVYGSITLKLYPNNEVRSYSDNYGFEMHEPLWNPINWPRNYETYYGGKMAGNGIPFDININGSRKVTPTHRVIK